MDVEQIPERFYIDIAVGVLPFKDVCAVHKLDPVQVEAIEDDPIFQQRVKVAQQAVDDDGRAFRARCRSIINRSVVQMERLMGDPETPASTRLETFKTLAKYGEMEPEKQAEAGKSGPTLSLTIIAPDGSSGFEQPVQGQIVSDQSPAPPETSTDQAPTLDIAPPKAVSGFF